MFHRGGKFEMGLTERTRALLKEPPAPFESEKVEAQCEKLYEGALPYHIKYYHRVIRPRNEAARLAGVQVEKSKREFTQASW